jgi:hypothetical protein
MPWILSARIDDYRRMRRRIACLCAIAAGGCMPPPMNVGYVAMDPAHAGGVDVQGQAGGGAWVPEAAGGGGAAVHVEPFVSRRVSLPIGGGLGGSGLGGHAPLRVGVRHRATRVFAYGAGIGPSITFESFGPNFVAGVADVEVVFGVDRRIVGFSIGVRPALSFAPGSLTFYALGDPTLAIALVGDTSLTIAVPFGGWVDTNTRDGSAFLSAALGVHRRF